MSKFADIQIDPGRREGARDYLSRVLLARLLGVPQVYPGPGTGRGFVAGDLHRGDPQHRKIPRRSAIGNVDTAGRGLEVAHVLTFGLAQKGPESRRRLGRHDDKFPGSQPEQAIDLDAALGTLPAVARAVVWLHDVEGYTHKEIGNLLGKSESFSKSQLSRAYQKLRPMLDAELDRTESAAAMQGSALGNC